MSGAWSGGKGDQRRKEDAQKIAQNWDRIFGKRKDLHKDKPKEEDKS